MLVLDVFVQVLLPILAMFGVGWLVDRRFNLDLNTIVKLNVNVFVPAFIFVNLVEAKLGRGVAGKVILFTICVSTGMFIAAALVLSSAWNLLKPYARAGRIRFALMIAVAAGVLYALDLTPVRILLICAVVGALMPERRSFAAGRRGDTRETART